jgi:hypothetical protein
MKIYTLKNFESIGYFQSESDLVEAFAINLKLFMFQFCKNSNRKDCRQIYNFIEKISSIDEINDHLRKFITFYRGSVFGEQVETYDGYWKYLELKEILVGEINPVFNTNTKIYELPNEINPERT